MLGGRLWRRIGASQDAFPSQDAWGRLEKITTQDAPGASQDAKASQDGPESVSRRPVSRRLRRVLRRFRVLRRPRSVLSSDLLKTPPGVLRRKSVLRRPDPSPDALPASVKAHASRIPHIVGVPSLLPSARVRVCVLPPPTPVTSGHLSPMKEPAFCCYTGGISSRYTLAISRSTRYKIYLAISSDIY